MKLTALNERPELEMDSKLSKKFIQFSSLIQELMKRDLSNELISFLNSHIDKVNAASKTDLKKALTSACSSINGHPE